MPNNQKQRRHAVKACLRCFFTVWYNLIYVFNKFRNYLDNQKKKESKSFKKTLFF